MTAPQQNFAPGMPDPAAGDLSKALGNPAPPPSPPQQQLGPVSPTETAAAQIAANPGVLVDNIGTVLKSAPILKQAPETALAAAQSATPINDAQTIAGLAHARSAQLAVIQPQSIGWFSHIWGDFNNLDATVSNAVHKSVNLGNVLKTASAIAREPSHVYKYLRDVQARHGWLGFAEAAVPLVVGTGIGLIGNLAGPEVGAETTAVGAEAGMAAGEGLIAGSADLSAGIEDAAGSSVAKTIGGAVAKAVNVGRIGMRAAYAGFAGVAAPQVAQNIPNTNLLFHDSWVRTGQANYVDPLTKYQVSPGRDLANLFFKPGSGPYSDLSGALDGLYSLALADPLGAAGRMAGEARSAEGLQLFGKQIGGYMLKDAETVDKLIMSPVIGAPLRRALQWISENDAGTIVGHYPYLAPLGPELGAAATPEAAAQVFKDGMEGEALATGAGKIPDAAIDGYTRGMLLPKYGLTDAFREAITPVTTSNLLNMPKRLISRTGFALDRYNNLVDGQFDISDPRSIPAIGNWLRKIGVPEIAVRANMNRLFDDPTSQNLIRTYGQIMSAAIKTHLLDTSLIPAEGGALISDAIDKAIATHLYSDVGTSGDYGMDMFGNDVSLMPDEGGNYVPRAVLPDQKSSLLLPSIRSLKNGIYSDEFLKSFTNESGLHAFTRAHLMPTVNFVNKTFKLLALATLGTATRIAASEAIPALFRDGPANMFDGAMAQWTTHAEQALLKGEDGPLRNAVADVVSHFGQGYLQGRDKEKLINYAADLLHTHDGHFEPVALAGGHSGNPTATSYDDLENARTTIFRGPRKNKVGFYKHGVEPAALNHRDPEFLGAWSAKVNRHAESPFSRTVAQILKEEETKATRLGDPAAMTEAARRTRAVTIKTAAAKRVEPIIRNVYSASLPDLTHSGVSSLVRSANDLQNALSETDLTPEVITEIKSKLVAVKRALGARMIVPAREINDPAITEIANHADHGFVKLTLNKDAAHASEIDGLQRSLRTKNPLISSFQSHANDATDVLMNAYYGRNMLPHAGVLNNILAGDRTLPGDLGRLLARPELQGAKGIKGQKTLSDALKANPKFDLAPSLTTDPRMDWANAPRMVEGFKHTLSQRNIFEWATTPVYSAFQRIIRSFSRDPQYLDMYWKFRQPLDAAVEAGHLTYQEAQMVAETHASQHMLQFVHNPQDRSFLSDVLSVESPFFFAQEQALRRVGRLGMENPGAFEEYMKANLMLQNFATVQQNKTGQPYIVLPGSQILGQGTGKLLQFLTAGTYAGIIPWGLTGSFDSLKSVDPFGAGSGSQMGVGANIQSAVTPSWGPIVGIPLKALSDIFSASEPKVAADIQHVLGPIPTSMPLWTQFVPNSLLQHVIEGGSSQLLTSNWNAAPNPLTNGFYSSLISAVQAIASQPAHFPNASDVAGQQRVYQQARSYTGIMWLLKTVLSFGSPISLSLAQANIKMHDALQTEINKNGLSQGTLNFFKQYPDATPMMTFKSDTTEGIGSWPETQNAYNWIENNGALINKYQHIGMYLAPPSIQTGAFSDPAYQLQIADNLRQLRSPAQFIKQMYIEQGNALWYDVVMPQVNQMYTNSPHNPLNYKVEQAALGYLSKVNPTWGAYKAANLGGLTAANAIGEFKAAASDPALASNPNMPMIKGMLGLWNNYETQYKAASQTQQTQLKEQWYNITTDVAAKEPSFAPLITQVFRRATP